MSVVSIVSCGQRIILVGDLIIGACIDGCDLIPTVQMASQQLSRLLEISGCGYPFYIFIMVPVGLWVTQVLVAVLCISYSAFLQLNPFSLDHLHFLCNHSATLIQSQEHPDILAADPGEMDQ